MDISFLFMLIDKDAAWPTRDTHKKDFLEDIYFAGILM
jgi:hypothetical protein